MKTLYITRSDDNESYINIGKLCGITGRYEIVSTFPGSHDGNILKILHIILETIAGSDTPLDLVFNVSIMEDISKLLNGDGLDTVTDIDILIALEQIHSSSVLFNTSSTIESTITVFYLEPNKQNHIPFIVATTGLIGKTQQGVISTTKSFSDLDVYIKSKLLVPNWEYKPSRFNFCKVDKEQLDLYERLQKLVKLRPFLDRDVCMLY